MRIFWLVLFLGIFSFELFASSPTLNVTLSGNTLSDLSSGSNSHVVVATVTLDSSGSNGFKLTLGSDSTGGKSKGKFVRYASGTYGDSLVPGNTCDYTLDVVSLGVGSLGSTEPSLPNSASVSSDIDLVYTPYIEPTTGYKYNVRINTSPNSRLFRGTFQDTLTLTLIDL